ncbi:class A beta-lactamase [Oceanobacillus senegalensis]|uniref:class A beta-lactamase n=1 Tax=Oceanobacillus senegalensis TaxID=1936063 RepID=UPI000A3142DB|nr:class A beta-lactamase [Oceanobacillus senegalensis]
MLQTMKFSGTLILSFILLVGCTNAETESSDSEPREEKTSTNDVFRQLEDEYDARLGIYALDTGTNQTVKHREDERFAYGSTHKALSVGVLLQQNNLNELDQTITFTYDDLVNYNPITEKHVDTGMTLREISDAAIRHSDNTAANLILEQIGGPEGFKEALRKIGDDVTNPERIEPELNEVEPGETQDTSTPEALATSLQAFTTGDALPSEKQDLLIDWLKRNTTGDALIRAGVPEGWEVGDKTGSASYGTRNDIAIIWPPNGDPIFLAVLSSRDQKDAESDDELIEKATEEVFNILTK